MPSILEKIITEKRDEEIAKLNAVKIVNNLFADLMERERDVLKRRFGLHGKDYETLESIGATHGLTRERVRQIESASIKKLKKLEKLETYITHIKSAVQELLTSHGGFMDQDLLLEILTVLCLDYGNDKNGDRESYRRHFDFVISKLMEENVEKVERSDKFNTFYKIKDSATEHFEELAEDITVKIEKLKQTMNFSELVEFIKDSEVYKRYKDLLASGEHDLSELFKSEVFPEKGEEINKSKTIYSFLQSLKSMARNKFGAWGLSHWPEIKPKKIGDKIYLILKMEGKPLHFKEIAEKINNLGFDNKKANPGSVHNELILDNRYELVGRGCYGLKAQQ